MPDMPLSIVFLFFEIRIPLSSYRALRTPLQEASGAKSDKKNTPFAVDLLPKTPFESYIFLFRFLFKKAIGRGDRLATAPKADHALPYPVEKAVGKRCITYADLGKKLWKNSMETEDKPPKAERTTRELWKTPWKVCGKPDEKLWDSCGKVVSV